MHIFSRDLGSPNFQVTTSTSHPVGPLYKPLPKSMSTLMQRLRRGCQWSLAPGKAALSGAYLCSYHEASQTWHGRVAQEKRLSNLWNYRTFCSTWFRNHMDSYGSSGCWQIWQGIEPLKDLRIWKTHRRTAIGYPRNSHVGDKISALHTFRNQLLIGFAIVCGSNALLEPIVIWRFDDAWVNGVPTF